MKIKMLINQIKNDPSWIKFSMSTSGQASKPYIEAASTLETIDDKYGNESGDAIVTYLLSNLVHYRGKIAKKVKNELKLELRRGNKN